MNQGKSHNFILYFCSVVALLTILSPFVLLFYRQDKIVVEEVTESTDSNSDDEEASEAAMFRSNPQHTGVYDSDSETSSYETLWSVKKENNAYFNPIVYNGVVYTEGEGSSILGFNIETGEKVWQYRQDDLGYTMTVPAIAGGQIFFSSVVKKLNKETYLYDYESTLHAVDIQTKEKMEHSNSRGDRFRVHNI